MKVCLQILIVICLLAIESYSIDCEFNGIAPRHAIKFLKSSKDVQWQASESMPPSRSLLKLEDSKNVRLLAYEQLYILLTSLFVTCLITSNILDAKLFSIKLANSFLGMSSIDNTAGMITFPFTFILGDIINEFYGSKAAKFTMYCGICMSILVFVVINIGQWLPYLDRPYNVSKDSFNMVFGCAKDIFAASVASFYVSSLVDIWLFKLLKQLTNGRHLWLRAYGSTAVSQLLDSFLMAYLAFSLSRTLTSQPSATLQDVLRLSVTGYLIKLLIAAASTPLLYGIKYGLVRRCGYSHTESSTSVD